MGCPLDLSFYANPPGRLEKGLREGGEYTYYVPPPVPRKISYSDPLVEALAEAQAQLGSLTVLERILPNPTMLIMPYLRREAVLSSRIEGTQASLTDVLEGEAASEDEIPPDTREVLNYIAALRQGLTEIQTRPLDLALLRELHATLMSGVRGVDKQPGAFRTEQNWIGGSYGRDLGNATYVPPAPSRMGECLQDFEAFLRTPPQMPPVLQAALLHYQFEAIHPFLDGNGRIGRLMIILFLVQRRTLTAPYLYLSAYFERNRTNYYEALRRVSEVGAYEEWLLFFLEGVTTQAEDAVNRAHALATLRSDFHRRLQEADATATAFQMVDRLFVTPFITIPQAQSLFNIAFPTARRAIEDYLEPVGVLVESTGKQRNRRWRSPAILKILEVETATPPRETPMEF